MRSGLLLIIFMQTVGTCLLEANSIDAVKKHNLSAYTWEDEEWPNEPFGDYLNRCMQYQGELQPFKKCKLAWNILERYYKQNQTPSNHVIGNDKLTWQNLQLLQGDEEDLQVYIANCVDRTSTEIGRVLLRAWIAQPTDDCIELQKRQSNAKFLLNNEVLFDELNQLLIEFKKSENFFLSFWLNDPLKQAASRHYWKLTRFPAIGDFVNENTTILGTSALIEHTTRVTSVGLMAATTALLPIFGASRLFTESLEPNDSMFDKYSRSLIGTGGPVFGPLSSIKNNIFQAGLFITAGIYCGFRIPDDFDWAHDSFTLSMCLQTKLQHVKKCIDILNKIGNLLNRYPSFPFQEDKNIHILIKDFENLELTTKKLITILDSQTFIDDATAIAHWGEILVAYRLLHKHIYDMEECVCALGELDAYMSITRLYKEFKNNRVRYSFVSYIENSDEPTISLNNVWSPLINPAYVVPNSIDFGGSSAIRNFIITGPNEGGKSTFVKSVATTLILAQSIGIVPAEQARITPFSYIATYLNIIDEHGKSLFEAQLERIKHILDHIDSMKKNQHSFIIIDELFNGTDARVGQAASYSVADYLSKKSNVISIFPTHFPELVTLENNGHSTNYKVSAIIEQDGNINHSYIVEKGASQQNIVLDIMKNENFNPTVINQTIQQLKKQK
jgi:DNA mismatch repair protein MutS